jgi:hypothetical protein
MPLHAMSGCFQFVNKVDPSRYRIGTNGGQIQIAIRFKPDLNRTCGFGSKGLRFDLHLKDSDVIQFKKIQDSIQRAEI